MAGGVFYGLVYLLDFQEIDSKAKLDAATLFDLVKLSFGVVAGAGALVALVVAYRRQRVDEAGVHREATRLHTERFSVAVDKLGSDSPAVRLGGVHALAGLADDAPDDSLRQTCIDVLCAYLQLPFTPDPGDDPAHQEEHHRYLALRKVRHTILRLIGDHYRRPKGPAAPGRDTTSTLPASPSTASWTSAALCSPAVGCPSTTPRSPAAWCPSTTRRVQPPTDFLLPSAVLLLHRSLLPPPG
ncbi:hypothetical protein [Streptomyces sp. NPDC052535]|uniref:hypothetical protein n=1 Tax=Streptomyces sp. NPDC052535 TaxID=3155531 RepID=UPI00343F9C2F